MRPCVVPLLLCCAAAPAAHAEIFIVNHFAEDLADLVDDGVCDVFTGAGHPGNQCTLRGAFNEAARTPAPDVVSLPPGALVELDLVNDGVDQSLVGDLDIPYPLTLDCTLCTGGPTADFPVIDASALGERVFDSTATFFVLRQTTVRGGYVSSSDPGGAIRSIGSELTVQNVRFEQNAAGFRGGAVFASGDDVEILNSDFVGNIGIGGSALRIENDGGSTATVSIERTSFRDNQDAAPSQRSQISLDGKLVATLGNIHVESGDGGLRAIDIDGLTVNASTFFENTGHGLYATGAPGATVYVANTLMAGNGTDCHVIAAHGSAQLNNLVQDGSCTPAGGNVTGQDPVLAAALESATGVFQQWRAPLLGSPALDAGTGAGGTLACPGFDIRAAPRPVDSQDADGTPICDIGAVEAQFNSLELVVNRLDFDASDPDPADGVCDTNMFTPAHECSLRGAVQTANASPGLDVVVLPAATISLTQGVTDDDGLTGPGDIEITEALTIVGQGAKNTTVTRGGPAAARIFDIDIPGPDQLVTLFGMTLAGGTAATTAESHGGAVRVNSDTAVIVNAMRFAGNTATGGGGAIALLNGELHAINTDFVQNEAARGAALFVDQGADEANVYRSSVRDSSGTGEDASAVYQAKGTELGIFNTTFAENADASILANVPEATVLRHLTVTSDVSGSTGVIVNSGAGLSIHNSVFDTRSSECRVLPSIADVPTDLRGNYPGFMNTCPDPGQGTAGGPTAPVVSEVGALGDLQPISTDPDAFLEGWVRIPRVGSALVDAGDDDVTLPLDQRGLLRPIDGNADGIAHIDIGAVEVLPERIFHNGFEAL